MKVSQRRLWLFGAIALGAIILITLLAAPANNKLNSGSTYGRAPDGYGAWYAFMSERGTPVQRWRKPFEALADNKNVKSPITLLRVYSRLTEEQLSPKERDWVERGNTLVILGVPRSVTEAPFSTIHKVEAGNVKIETGRRNKVTEKPVLGDRFGSIVWQETIGKGQVIYATTPHLAANAYQDFQGNYQFLAQLVTRSGVGSQESGESETQNSVWVDEYIHGYKDPEIVACQERGAQGKASQGGSSQGRGQGRSSQGGSSQGRGSQGNEKSSGTITCEQEQSLWSYLGQTPIFPAFVQGLILLLVAIWAGNRRFGKPVTIPAPEVNNNEAYIQALGGVLQKANSSELILEVVGKEERLQLQKALLLGQVPLDDRSLVEAWVRQTGRPATELEQLLQMQSRKRRMSELDLLSWLGKWEEIRRHLPYYSAISKEREL
jgi:uncharacterized membrane protein YgcG